VQLAIIQHHLALFVPLDISLTQLELVHNAQLEQLQHWMSVNNALAIVLHAVLQLLLVQLAL